MSDLELTLRFTNWQCGHHATRPADIPVHSLEQAFAILHAISSAISQPGHARAVIYGEEFASDEIYLTDDYVSPSKPRNLGNLRTVVFHGTPEEMQILESLGSAYHDCYGGDNLCVWDGKTNLENHNEVVTTLTVEEINQITQPVDWHEEGQRTAVCVAPPILKPASEMVKELLDWEKYLETLEQEATQQHAEGGAS